MPSHHNVPHDLLQTVEPVLWGLDAWTALAAVILVVSSFQLLTVGGLASDALVVCLWVCFLTVGFGEVDGISMRLLLAWAGVWVLRRRRRPCPRTALATHLDHRT